MVWNENRNGLNRLDTLLHKRIIRPMGFSLGENVSPSVGYSVTWWRCTRPQPEILTYEQTYNGYMIAQLKNGKSKEYILEQVDAYGKHGNRGEKMPLSWPL